MGSDLNRPPAPPVLSGLTNRREQLDKERADLFRRWRAALEANGGNVTHTAKGFQPTMTRNQGNQITRRLGLVEYAAQLRLLNMGRSMGRGR